MLPHVLCAYWGFHSLCSEAATTAYSIWRFRPERMPLMPSRHRPPSGMPGPGIDPMTFRLQDLRLAQLS